MNEHKNNQNNMKQPKSIQFEMNGFDPRFISEIFEYNNLNWILQSIIHKKDNINHKIYYYVMLSLVCMPSILSEIIISFRIFCHQTMSSVSGITVLSIANNNHLNSQYLVMQSDLDNQSSNSELITFTCSVHLLKIKDKYQTILYEYPCQLEWQLYDKLIKTLQFEWTIDVFMIDKLYNCIAGQRFESQNIYNDLFVVGIAPNGLEYENENKTDTDTVIYLCICSLPFDVSCINLHWQLKCNELNICQTIKSYVNAYEPLSKAFIPKSDEFMNKIKDLDEITINIQVKMMRSADKQTQYTMDKDGRLMRRSYSSVSNSARATNEGSPQSRNKTRSETQFQL